MQSSRAVQLSTTFESCRHGLTWRRDIDLAPPRPSTASSRESPDTGQAEEEDGEAKDGLSEGGGPADKRLGALLEAGMNARRARGGRTSARSDVSEAPSARSVAERYLQLKDGDFESHVAFPRAILAPKENDADLTPYADLKTPTPPPPKDVPTLQQARRELRAKLLR